MKKHVPTVDSLLKNIQRLKLEIVAYKEKNASLEAQVARAKALSDASFEAIFLSEEGICLDQNRSAERLFGYTKSEAVGRAGTDWIAPKDRDLVKNHMLTGYGKPYEVTALKKDGSTFPCEIQGQMIDHEGQTIRITALRDLTERKKTEIALRESEHRFRELANHIREVFWIYDCKKKQVLYVNPAYREVWGRPLQALLENNQEWEDSIHPDDREYANETFRNILKSPQGKKREYRIVRADGTVRWVSDRGFPVYGDDGQVHRIVGIAEDITANKITGEKLQASEEKFFKAFQSSPDAIVITRVSDGKIIDVNEGFIRSAGYSREEVVGRTTTDLGLWADHSDKQEFYDLITNKGRATDCEIQFRIKSCALRTGLLSGELIEINNEDCFIGTIRDITDQKRAQEELLKSHQTFLTVLDGIDATIHVSDMDTYEILFMNKHMIDHFGGNFTGGICYKAFRGYDRPCDHCTNAKLLDANGNPTGVRVWETKNPKAKKWFMNYDRAIRWIDGRIVRLQIATDITEVKKLEKERQTTEMQLRQAQKMESVGRLAGGVAHDFNNMLGVIIGHAELAMEQVAPTMPIYGDLKEIYQAARRSAELTRQLLAFARKQTISPQVLNLNQTVDGMLKMLRRIIGEDIDLVWEPGRKLWHIKIDPAQIDQILVNLCVNASDAIKGMGRITIETKNIEMEMADCRPSPGMKPGVYVLLIVTDDGCGMTTDTIDNIFEPFFTTKEVGEGTGLGLSTVYGIVKQNDGFIYATSRPGEGSTFRVYFPITDRSSEMIEASIEKSFQGGNETIILAEDEPSFLKLGQTILKRFGYQILAANSPLEALDMVKAHEGPIHLLITDVVMPEMDGVVLKNEVTKLIPDIKVLFMSGYTPDAVIDHGVLSEGMHFLAKPFSVGSLTSKVREVLDNQ